MLGPQENSELSGEPWHESMSAGRVSAEECSSCEEEEEEEEEEKEEEDKEVEEEEEEEGGWRGSSGGGALPYRCLSLAASFPQSS